MKQLDEYILVQNEPNFSKNAVSTEAQPLFWNTASLSLQHVFNTFQTPGTEHKMTINL